jgi:hypothetical protein
MTLEAGWRAGGDGSSPTPVSHPYIAVGRDYFGDTIRGVSEYHEFERRSRAYPERFAGPVPRPHAEFASSYIFSFLDACVARLVPASRPERRRPSSGRRRRTSRAAAGHVPRSPR